MMEARLSSIQLRLAVMFLFLVTRPRTEAMQITSSGPQTIQKAKGETVSLGCTFTPGADDKGELDIEWSNVSPDMTQKDKLILSHTGGQMHYNDPSLSGKIKFSADPTQGDASITFSNVEFSDTATYQCKVKKLPGVDMRKVTLVVMVPPSAPKCWVEGSEEKGGAVSLRCKSPEGSVPLTYVWKRESGGAMPSAATQDSQSGVLSIRNHTESNVGIYACEVKNSVGQAQCKYSLRAYNPTDKVGVIVGAVIGALLLLLLLLLLIWLLVCCCHKKRYQKEVANEIREDAQAPESRPSSRQSSRHSSLRSVMGYRTHHGMQYNAVASPLPSISETGLVHTAGSGGSATGGDQNVSLNYDPRYGYAV